MKYELLGFVFGCSLYPTPELKIKYYELTRKLKNFRCRISHDSTWIPQSFDNITYRWYCCKTCRKAWFLPMTGAGNL